MQKNSLCAYFLNVMFNLLLLLGVDPCYVSGQVVIIGLLTVQIHSKLCSIVWNWLTFSNGNSHVAKSIIR